MTQSRIPTFALVIPTLNEAGNIRMILDRACAALAYIFGDWEILVVDDDSKDGTPDIVAEYSRNHDRVRLITRRDKRGLAGAITYGWEQTAARILGVMDADLQHPPELLPGLVSQIRSGADIAIASRYMRPHSMDGWNPMRKFLSRISVLASVPVQRPEIRVKDPLSGFFVVRRECIEGLEFQNTGFKLLLEIMAKGRIQFVREVPFTFASRNRDRSKADWKTGVDYASLLYKLLRDKERTKLSRAFSSPSGTDDGPQRSLQIILGLLPLVLGLQLIIWTAYLPSALRGNADFRNCYTAGFLVRSGQGHRLYDYALQKHIEDQYISKAPALLPYVHLPYEALIFAPLSLLDYTTAYLCWLGINVLLVLLCYWLLRRRFWQLQQQWGALPVLFVVGFMPLAAALMQGQDSVLTLLLFALALASVDAGREWLAGFLVGLAAYKFQLVLPMAFFFLVWRKWRLLLGAAFSVATTLGFSLLVSGWSQLVQYARSLHKISTTFSAGNEVLYIMPVSRMPNLRGLVTAIPYLTPGPKFALVVVLSVATLVAAVWAGRHASTQWRLAIAASATTLVGYHVLMHDLSILLIVFAVLLDDTDTRAFWSIPLVWLTPILCFLGHDYLTAVALIAFFVGLILRTRRKYACELPPGATSPYARAMRSV